MVCYRESRETGKNCKSRTLPLYAHKTDMRGEMATGIRRLLYDIWSIGNQ